VACAKNLRQSKREQNQNRGSIEDTYRTRQLKRGRMEAILVVLVGFPIVQKRLCLRLVHDLDRVLGLQWMLRQ
jgi:hypothetical protein